MCAPPASMVWHCEHFVLKILRCEARPTSFAARRGRRGAAPASAARRARDDAAPPREVDVSRKSDVASERVHRTRRRRARLLASLASRPRRARERPTRRGRVGASVSADRTSASTAFGRARRVYARGRPPRAYARARASIHRAAARLAPLAAIACDQMPWCLGFGGSSRRPNRSRRLATDRAAPEAASPRAAKRSTRSDRAQTRGACLGALRPRHVRARPQSPS